MHPVRPSVSVSPAVPQSWVDTPLSRWPSRFYLRRVITLPSPLPAARNQFSLLQQETHPIMPCNRQHTCPTQTPRVWSTAHRFFIGSRECNVTRFSKTSTLAVPFLIFSRFGGASRLTCLKEVFREPLSFLLIDGCVGGCSHIQWLHGGRLMRAALQQSCCCFHISPQSVNCNSFLQSGWVDSKDPQFKMEAYLHLFYFFSKEL